VGAGAKDLFGLDPEELMSRTEVDHAWVHPEDRSRFIGALEASARDLTTLDEEVRVESPGGDYRWVRSIGHPRRGAEGTIIWDGVALDVHDRRAALDALSRLRDNETSEDRFSAIAAQDVKDRLEVMRLALSAFSQTLPTALSTSFSQVTDSFKALEHAVGAASELVDVVDQAEGPYGPASTRHLGLTSRQVEILDLAASGASNRKIGEKLGLSEGTVKQHMSRIFKGLGVRNRAEAVACLRSNIANN
jgi:DNA-binding NarL/FixJ family response regulator